MCNLDIYVFIKDDYRFENLKWIKCIDLLDKYDIDDLACYDYEIDDVLKEIVAKNTDMTHAPGDSGQDAYNIITTVDFDTFQYHAVIHNWYIPYDEQYTIEELYEYERLLRRPHTFPQKHRDWILIQ